MKQVFKKVLSYGVLLVLGLSMFGQILVYAQDEMRDLDTLLLERNTVFSEIDKNPRIGFLYGNSIKSKSYALFNKLDNIASKIANKYGNVKLLSYNSNSSNDYKIDIIKKNIDLIKQQINKVNKVKEILVGIVERKSKNDNRYKKGGIIYKLFGYVYYKLVLKQMYLQGLLKNQQKKLEELNNINKLDAGLNEIKSLLDNDTNVDSINNDVTEGNSNKYKEADFISFKENNPIKVKRNTNTLYLGKFTVKGGPYIDYYGLAGGLDEPIKILKCKLYDTYGDIPNPYTPLKITGGFLKGINYSGGPQILEKLYVVKSDRDGFELAVKKWPITITDGMKLVLNVKTPILSNGGIECKFLYKKIGTKKSLGFKNSTFFVRYTISNN